MLEDTDRVAAILMDAATFGDEAAARKWKCSTRTLRRHRVRLRTDAELAASVREMLDSVEVELGAMRVRFLRKALVEMEKRIGHPDTPLSAIAEAAKVVGEMHQVAEAMGDVGSDGPDPEAESAPGDGAAEATHGPH